MRALSRKTKLRTVRNSDDVKRTAVVAGGAGFLGSHLCRKLLDLDYRVVCVDSFLTGQQRNISPLLRNHNFTLINSDIVDALPVEVHVDQVFNLACAASPPKYQEHPIHTMQTCVTGTHNLLRLAETNDARFLQASTSEVYGDPHVHPQPETYRGNVNPFGPRACYDEGKRAAEALCYDFKESLGVNVKVARIFNTYGPRMLADDGRVVSNFIVQALKGEPITIFGSGQQTRSFCYVDDLVEGLIRLMNSDETVAEPVNLGNPTEFTIVELAELVLQQTGSKSKMVKRKLPVDDPKQRRPDISRAEELLNWQPRVSLAQGLQSTIDYFAKQLGQTEAKRLEIA